MGVISVKEQAQNHHCLTEKAVKNTHFRRSTAETGEENTMQGSPTPDSEELSRRQKERKLNTPQQTFSHPFKCFTGMQRKRREPGKEIPSLAWYLVDISHLMEENEGIFRLSPWALIVWVPFLGSVWINLFQGIKSCQHMLLGWMPKWKRHIGDLFSSSFTLLLE